MALSETSRPSSPGAPAAAPPPPRHWTLAAVAVLLCGPTVLSFFAGGYFSVARTWAGLLAWVIALLAIMTRPQARLGRAALLTFGGLAGLAVFTLLSILWAPVAGSAYSFGQIDVLYLGGLLAAWLALSRPGPIALVEPVLALGASVVIGYGLAGRVLPGLLHFYNPASADGRLNQPLTYWNAIGELAALGLVLCARLLGDPRRPAWMRALAGAAAAALGMGLYVSFSRGALFACATGLIALVVLAPNRAQLRGLGVAITAALLAGAAAAPFAGVTNLSGPLATRETQGAIVGVLLVAIMALAAAAAIRAGRDPAGSRPLPLPAHSGRIVTALIVVLFAGAIVAGAHERSGVAITGGAARLGTLESNRYDYWQVSLREFASHPIIGAGAGAWTVWWLRYRPYADGATDAHSLELQTLGDLGLVGFALLLTLIAGLVLAARAAMRRAPAAAAGLVAAAVVYLIHSPLDWDWQMPALTLVAIAVAGGLLVLADSSEIATAG